MWIGLVCRVCGAAIVIYLLIVAVPEYTFFVTLIFFAMLTFGTAIFIQNPLAKFMAPASFALIILIGTSMTDHVQFIDKPFIRVVMISSAVLYVVIALGVLERLSTNPGQAQQSSHGL